MEIGVTYVRKYLARCCSGHVLATSAATARAATGERRDDEMAPLVSVPAFVGAVFGAAVFLVLTLTPLVVFVVQCVLAVLLLCILQPRHTQHVRRLLCWFVVVLVTLCRDALSPSQKLELKLEEYLNDLSGLRASLQRQMEQYSPESITADELEVREPLQPGIGHIHLLLSLHHIFVCTYIYIHVLEQICCS